MKLTKYEPERLTLQLIVINCHIVKQQREMKGIHKLIYPSPLYIFGGWLFYFICFQ